MESPKQQDRGLLIDHTPKTAVPASTNVTMEKALQGWRGRRTSAPVPARRASVTLSSGNARSNSLLSRPKEKLDSDDDTNYSLSTTNSTPMSNSRAHMSRMNGRRTSYGSDVSDLSPPFISPNSPLIVRRRSGGGKSNLVCYLFLSRSDLILQFKFS